MKKTHYLLKLYGAVLILLIVIAIGSNSCKKGNTDQSQEIESLISDYVKTTKSLNKNDFSQLQPIWNSLYTSEYDNDIFYEVDLINPNHFFLTDQKTDPQKAAEYEKFNNIKLLIRKNNETGKTTFYYMSLISGKVNQDFRNMHYKKLPDFTGSVHYYSLNGEFINGWTYNDGKVANKIKALSAKLMTQMSMSPQKLSQTVGCPIEEIERYQTICAMGDGHTDMECVRRLIGTDHVFTDCTGDSSDDGDGGGDGGVGDSGGGSGGGDTPPYYDCTGLLNGTAYNSDCGCIGGNTGIAACPPVIEVKDDSLKMRFPCMVKKILDTLLANSTYGKLIQPFQTVQLPNGSTLNSVQGLPNLIFSSSPQAYGGAVTTYQLGKTESVGGYSSKIFFNTSAIGNASQLFLQITTIHEVAHAYATFYIKAGSYGVPVDTTRYSTWAMDIINFESISRSELAGGNFNDHSLFIENYVDKFVQILKEVNGNTYTDKQYQMAAIYGLDNPGNRTYNYLGTGFDLYAIYKDKLQKSYNSLLTKFGITTAERDAFYLANLINVPVAQKLPANCP